MKIFWERLEGNRRIILIARTRYENGARSFIGLRDTDLDPVQDWCVASKCGERISFDMFKFRNEQEMAVFLLKWS